MTKNEKARLRRIEELTREALRTYLFRECDGCDSCLVCELAELLERRPDASLNDGDS